MDRFSLNPLLFLLVSFTFLLSPIWAELDLYVRDRYRTAASDGEGDEECGVCAERDGCFSTKQFYVQDECRQRRPGASIYGGLSETVVCRQDFPNVTCQDDPPSSIARSEVDCAQTWNVDQCEFSLHMTVLPKWCIKSNQPWATFVVPFFETRSFSSIDDCNQDKIQVTSLYPDDPQLCIQVGFFNGSDYLYGSRKFYCQYDTAHGEKYLDRQCSQPAQLPSTVDGASSQCPTTDDGNDVYTSTCNSPSIYCKELYSTDFGLQVEPTVRLPTSSASQLPLAMVLLFAIGETSLFLYFW